MIGYRWTSRYQHYCVSVIEGIDAAEALARFGGGGPTVHGGPREAHALATGYPVVRVVEYDGWAVAVEQQSVQGTRPEVLRRLAIGGRAVSLSRSGDGMPRLGYAEAGTVVGSFEPPGGPADSSWPTLEALARRAGVPVAELTAGPGIMPQFAAGVCGFPLTDDIVAAPGLIAAVLPVLPDLPTLVVAARSETDALLVVTLDSAVPGEIVVAHVREFLVEAGVPNAEALISIGPEPVADDSPGGRTLRRLIAEPLLTDGARERANAALVALALLVKGPRRAVIEMTHRRSGTVWRDRLLADLADVEVSDQALAVALEEAQARRARSRPVDLSSLKDN